MDYGARLYDLQLSRWSSDDPLYQFASPYDFCGGDPVNRIDPDGRFVGTILGGVIGFTSGYFSSSGGNWDEAWKQAAVGAAAGLAADLVVVSMGTATPVAIGIFAGAAGGFAGYTTNSLVRGERWDPGQAAVSTVTGAVFGLVAGGAAHYIGPWLAAKAPKTMRWIGKASEKLYSPLRKLFGTKSQVPQWGNKPDGGGDPSPEPTPPPGSEDFQDGLIDGNTKIERVAADSEDILYRLTKIDSDPTFKNHAVGYWLSPVKRPPGIFLNSYTYFGKIYSTVDKYLPKGYIYTTIDLRLGIEKMYSNLNRRGVAFKYQNFDGQLKVPGNSNATFKSYKVLRGDGSFIEGARLVRSSDGHIWFSPDHYKSFYLLDISIK